MGERLQGNHSDAAAVDAVVDGEGSQGATVRPVIRRGGGPRTPAGRARSSQNALRHGAYARVTVLPGEREEDFEVLVAHVASELRPQGPLAELMVRDIAGLYWRSLRVERVEAEVIADVLRRPLSCEEVGAEWGASPDDVDITEAASVAEARTLDEVVSYRHSVKAARRLRYTEFLDWQLVRALKMYPDMLKTFRAMAKRYNYLPYEPEHFVNLRTQLDAGRRIPVVEALDDHITDYERVALYEFVEDNYERLRSAAAAVRRRRLRGLLHHELPHRVLDDLGRAIGRKLAEFRRHSAWVNRSSFAGDLVGPAEETGLGGFLAASPFVVRD
jgi:hypothetical protein